MVRRGRRTGGYHAISDYLAIQLLEGDHVRPDPEWAFAHLGERAKEGHAVAEMGLGRAYPEGRGTEANAIKGARLFAKAARRGLAEAQRRPALLLL